MKIGKSDMTVIFRADKELWSIDNKKKIYTEITKGDMEKMKKKMEEGLKNLPPEQRKKIEEMMKGKMKTETPKIVYKKLPLVRRLITGFVISMKVMKEVKKWKRFGLPIFLKLA